MKRMEKNLERLYKTIREGEGAVERGELTKDPLKPEEEVSLEKQSAEKAQLEGNSPDADQRSKIIARYPELDIGRSLSSRFTIMGDKTLLAFHKYSPWAVLKTSDPFKSLPVYMRKEENIRQRRIHTEISADKKRKSIVSRGENNINLSLHKIQPTQNITLILNP